MASTNVFSSSVIGADVHKKAIVCCARYLEGDEWKEAFATFSTKKDGILRMAEWCKQYNPSFVLMESTGVYWVSPYNYLERAGLRVYIVNPRSVKGMIGKKTDKTDAEWLATKGNEGSFKPSYIPADKWRKLRDVERDIIMQTQEVTRRKNRIVKMFLAMGFRLDSVFSDTFGLNAERAKEAILAGKTPIEVLESINTKHLKASEEDLLEAFKGDLDEERVRVINTNKKVLQTVQAEIAENKAYLLQKVQEYSPLLYDLFQTLPGIDEYHAASLVVEFGGLEFIDAFSCVEKFASWLGVSPGNKESGGKRHQCKSGHGNWAARRCLCEAAHAASHVKGSTIQSRYNSQKARLGTKKAIISCAHYLVRLLYYVASKKSPYEDPCINYEEIAFEKTVKRFILMAKKFKEKWEVQATNLETGEEFQSTRRNTATRSGTEGTQTENPTPASRPASAAEPVSDPTHEVISAPAATPAPDPEPTCMAESAPAATPTPGSEQTNERTSASSATNSTAMSPTSVHRRTVMYQPSLLMLIWFVIFVCFGLHSTSVQASINASAHGEHHYSKAGSGIFAKRSDVQAMVGSQPEIAHYRVTNVPLAPSKNAPNVQQIQVRGSPQKSKVQTI